MKKLEKIEKELTILIKLYKTTIIDLKKDNSYSDRQKEIIRIKTWEAYKNARNKICLKYGCESILIK